MKKIIMIEGMMCAHCSGAVSKALKEVEGVNEVTVSLEDKKATVILSEAVDDALLKAAVENAGYEVLEVADEGR